MLTCSPCDDKPANGTNALASIHVFNYFHRYGSDIKRLHVKVKKTALLCMRKDSPVRTGQNGPGSRLAPPCSTNMVCKRNIAVMYL